MFFYRFSSSKIDTELTQLQCYSCVGFITLENRPGVIICLRRWRLVDDYLRAPVVTFRTMCTSIPTQSLIPSLWLWAPSQENKQELGKTSMKKKKFSFGYCPNHLNSPPPWPQFRLLGPFFSDVKIQDLKVTWGLKVQKKGLQICGEGREIWVILRCWGNSSILCQQNSDAL